MERQVDVIVTSYYRVKNTFTSNDIVRFLLLIDVFTTSLQFSKKSTPGILKAPKLNNNKDIIKLKVNAES